jgi:hypothetical protein
LGYLQISRKPGRSFYRLHKSSMICCRGHEIS